MLLVRDLTDYSEERRCIMFTVLFMLCALIAMLMFIIIVCVQMYLILKVSNGKGAVLWTCCGVIALALHAVISWVVLRQSNIAGELLLLSFAGCIAGPLCVIADGSVVFDVVKKVFSPTHRESDIELFCTESYSKLLNKAESVYLCVIDVYDEVSISADEWSCSPKHYKKARKKLRKILRKLQFISSCINAMNSSFDDGLKKPIYESLVSDVNDLLKLLNRVNSDIRADDISIKQYNKIRDKMCRSVNLSYAIRRGIVSVRVPVGQSLTYDKIVKDIELEFKYLYK